MRRLSHTWTTWIEEILLAHDTPEVTYELGLAALPDQSVAGQFLGFMVIEVMIPGDQTIVEGESVDTVISTRALLPPWAPQSSVQETVRGLLDDLYAQRDQNDPQILNAAQWAPQAPGTES